ncbi:MAG: 4-(cytidine 5'-diphospho)-2-C-methyl-D-erythritol kinase [Elusimicrobia bacterium CG08_land_8_20_14_0_20_59_10]|nr:MAG: 4-(cytidine 5'-diphospho)-2-C-methyl-D-erythritol kinase [Elusimicrobia bacterium CG08_land_8_20_14_0_20_59_10]
MKTILNCRIQVKAPAKINLFLEVTGRRRDGYHNLATIFARLALCDTLTFKKGRVPGISLKVTGLRIPGLKEPEDNIVYKAAAAFLRAFGIKPAVEIRLFKALPSGAGLGGGSSDAAAALLGLCRLYGIPRAVNMRKLLRLASALGSDVPFFLLDSPMAAGTGRGVRLKPVKFRGRAPRVVLAYPGAPVSTGKVYSRLKLAPAREIKTRLAEFRGFVKSLESGVFDASRVFNRLEDAVLPVNPRVRGAKRGLAGLLRLTIASQDHVPSKPWRRRTGPGAEAVLMSGSGAAVFALVRGLKKARALAAAASRNRSYRVFLTEFC